MCDEELLERTTAGVLAKAREITGVVGVLLVGSVATGDTTANSDYDFVVLIDDSAPWTMPFRDGGREAWIDKSGRQVEVAYSTIGRSRRRCAEEEADGSCLRRAGLARSRVLYSQGTSVETLIEEARRIVNGEPPPMRQQDVLWECYDIWNQLKDIEDRFEDRPTVQFLAAPLFAQQVRFFFRLTRRWQPRPRDMVAAVAATDAQLYALTVDFLSADSARRSYDVLLATSDYLSSRFGLRFEGGYVSER